VDWRRAAQGAAGEHRIFASDLVASHGRDGDLPRHPLVCCAERTAGGNTFLFRFSLERFWSVDRPCCHPNWMAVIAALDA